MHVFTNRLYTWEARCRVLLTNNICAENWTAFFRGLAYITGIIGWKFFNFCLHDRAFCFEACHRSFIVSPCYLCLIVNLTLSNVLQGVVWQLSIWFSGRAYAEVFERHDSADCEYLSRTETWCQHSYAQSFQQGQMCFCANSVAAIKFAALTVGSALYTSSIIHLSARTWMDRFMNFEFKADLLGLNFFCPEYKYYLFWIDLTFLVVSHWISRCFHR